jgi:hypothetical protein
VRRRLGKPELRRAASLLQRARDPAEREPRVDLAERLELSHAAIAIRERVDRERSDVAVIGEQRARRRDRDRELIPFVHLELRDREIDPDESTAGIDEQAVRRMRRDEPIRADRRAHAGVDDPLAPGLEHERAEHREQSPDARPLLGARRTFAVTAIAPGRGPRRLGDPPSRDLDLVDVRDHARIAQANPVRRREREHEPPIVHGLREWICPDEIRARRRARTHRDGQRDARAIDGRRHPDLDVTFFGREHAHECAEQADPLLHAQRQRHVRPARLAIEVCVHDERRPHLHVITAG